ncbi:MAG TPA: neutral/alkaline non-lysosomal ceramidase N-terminal domain-containing protein [Sphingomonas sp.]|nr:neutral/alkaline non-lysosomal ceramidase N-terminal domain-containing protein [Sphingomonas sp.]
MRTCLLALAATLFAVATSASAAPSPVLRVGAARIEVTPPADQLPKGNLGVLDPVYVRAIVIDDGSTRAALVTVDSVVVPSEIWSNVGARVERELGIPVKQLLLTATHTHSAFLRGKAFENNVFDAVRQARRASRPARMAYGVGVSYINVNRNLIDPVTHRWWEGPNYDGPSDKTVAVVRFESLTGEPIAIYYNYAVHGVVTGTLDLVSGDIPGAASAYIEESLGSDMVAVWSTGAAGDQNPVYFQQTYDLREIRVRDYARRGEDISNAMPPGGQGLDRNNPQVAKLMNQQKRMILSMGQMLGEEVLHVTRSGLERPTTSVTISGAQTTISCPGRRRTDTGRAGYPGAYVDADPISIRLSLLRIGDTVIGGVDAEVFNLIGQRFKRESPYKNSMMATLTNGMAASGYIPNDAAFGFNTFEVLSSRLKPGCAESAIVDGLLELAGKTADARGPK